jgi:hypothetical protein
MPGPDDEAAAGRGHLRASRAARPPGPGRPLSHRPARPPPEPRSAPLSWAFPNPCCPSTAANTREWAQTELFIAYLFPNLRAGPAAPPRT